MKFYSFYSLIIVFCLVLIFSLCFFIPIFNTSGFVLAYTPNSNQQQYLSISTSFSLYILYKTVAVHPTGSAL